MTDFNATAEFVRRWGEKQKDIIALGDALKEIGSVDQAAKEKQAELDKVNLECQTAEATLKSTKAEHTAFMARRSVDLDAHKKAVQHVVDEANQEAVAVVSKANEAAKEIIEAANGEVARIQSAHAETMKAANAEVKAAQDELTRLMTEIDDAKNSQEMLEKNIQSMKSLARATLGAA